MASKSRIASKLKKGMSLADADREFASSSESEGVLYDTLERLGLNERVEALRTKLDEMDVRKSVQEAQEYLSDQIESASEYARENPGKVIGGAAGVLVGASLLAYALSRSGGKKKSSSRSKSRKTSGGSSKKRGGSSPSSKKAASSKKRSR